MPAVPASAPPTAEVRYELVLDEPALRSWIERAIEAGAVAISTKTTHPDPARGAICGIALALEAGTACYVPFGGAPVASGQLDPSGPAEVSAGPPATPALRLVAPAPPDPSPPNNGKNPK